MNFEVYSASGMGTLIRAEFWPGKHSRLPIPANAALPARFPNPSQAKRNVGMAGDFAVLPIR